MRFWFCSVARKFVTPLCLQLTGQLAVRSILQKGAYRDVCRILTSTDNVHMYVYNMYVHKKSLIIWNKENFQKTETGDTFVERLFWCLMSCIEIRLIHCYSSIKCKKEYLQVYGRKWLPRTGEQVVIRRGAAAAGTFYLAKKYFLFIYSALNLTYTIKRPPISNFLVIKACKSSRPFVWY